MISLKFRLIKPDEVPHLRAWMGELMQRQDEVRETFRQEGVRHETAYLLQGGIEMPDREYYLAESEAMRAMREKYRGHVITMLKLAGWSDAEARAERWVK